MKKGILSLGLLASLACTSHAIVRDFVDGTGLQGQSADLYADITLSGWLYDKQAEGSTIPYTWPIADGAGIIAGPSIAGTSTFVFTEHPISSFRVEALMFGSGTWSLTAFDENGQIVATSDRTVTGEGWQTTDDSIARARSGPFEPFLPIYSIRLDFSAPLAIDNLKYQLMTELPAVNAPDGGSTAALLVLGCLGLFHLRPSNRSHARR